MNTCNCRNLKKGFLCSSCFAARVAAIKPRVRIRGLESLGDWYRTRGTRRIRQLILSANNTKSVGSRDSAYTQEIFGTETPSPQTKKAGS